MKKILFLLTILMFIPILGNSQTIRKKIAKKEIYLSIKQL